MIRAMLRFAPVLLMGVALAHAAAPAAAQEKYGISQNENIRFLADMEKRPGMQKLPNGVLYRVLETGAGEPTTGRLDKVTVSYSGYLINGKRFDYSRKPATFIVSRTVPGWVQVLLKMREGDRWEVIVPADLAYGEGSAGNVPPGQSLLFVIKLDHVEHPS